MGGRWTHLLAVAALAAPAWASDDLRAEEGFVLRGCRVETVAGEAIDPGTVVVRGGRIEAVGPAGDVETPPGMDVVDAAGKVLLPGFVHPATRLGLAGSGGGSTSTSDLERDVRTDELAPWRDANFWPAGSGFSVLGLVPGDGIVAGRGIAVRTATADAEAAVLREDALLRVNVGPGGRFEGTLVGLLKSARSDLGKLEKHAADHAKWKEAKAKAEAEKKKPPKEPKAPKLDEKREPVRRVLRGETALLAYVSGSAAVHTLQEALADEKTRGPDLRLYVVCSGDAYRAAGVLADLGATCLVRGGTASFPNTNQLVCPALLYRRAGARVALLPQSDSRDALRGFRLTLARTVRAGFPRDEALRGATRVGAEMLGLGEETGTIEKGRRADLVLYSGDPLHAVTRIERVWIGGVAVEETP
jgi:imidazolonepropionase-like amidohydrolase